MQIAGKERKLAKKNEDLGVKWSSSTLLSPRSADKPDSRWQTDCKHMLHASVRKRRADRGRRVCLTAWCAAFILLQLHFAAKQQQRSGLRLKAVFSRLKRSSLTAKMKNRQSRQETRSLNRRSASAAQVTRWLTGLLCANQEGTAEAASYMRTHVHMGFFKKCIPPTKMKSFRCCMTQKKSRKFYKERFCVPQFYGL